MVRQPKTSAPQGEKLKEAVSFLLRFKRFGRDLFGVLALSTAAVTTLALIGLTSGAWLSPWAAFLQRAFGWGSVLVVAGLALAGIVLLDRRQEAAIPSLWGRVIALEVAAFMALALLSAMGGSSVERAEAGMDGGLVGWGIAELFALLIPSFVPDWLVSGLRLVILLAVVLVTGLYGFGRWDVFKAWLARRLAEERAGGIEVEESPIVSVASEAEDGAEQAVKKLRRRTETIPPEYRKQFRLAPEEDGGEPLPRRDDRLPPLELLNPAETTRPSERHINQTAGLIEKTLAEFGIPARVVSFQVGPTVTQFAVEPGYIQKGNGEEDEARQKVRVAQISALQRDLALALSADRLRIQAPVPGRPYVGIEVPNLRTSLVRLRPVLESETFYSGSSPLMIALGRDVSGQPVVADLTRMPHLLIAGTTGSGKSVCIAAITICLVMNNTPEDLRLVMIDPKMVELVPFNGLPHLYGKVETDLERITQVLRWVVVEMERRYKLLEELRARDIEAYNRKARRRGEIDTLPRIVVLVDELADLMMMAAEQTETTLVRLAQMARATGIHLVLATQRPSTDVVTGLIKANFPARISFAVASGTDSRVILDGGGAEHLLGRGDMLYLAPEAGSPVRSQGVLLTDQEIEKVITFWQKAWPQVEELEPPWDAMIEKEAVLGDRDDMIEQAIALIKESGHASASHLQRGLRIGYPRAARLIDELEDLGLIGPSRGGGREREILLDLSEDGEDEEYSEQA